MEKAVATTGANPRAPGPRAPGNRDTLMVGQTVHPDIPNEATLQAYGAYVESDESDDESIFSINSLPNLLSESSDDRLRGFPHSHVSVRVLPVGISVSH